MSRTVTIIVGENRLHIDHSVWIRFMRAIHSKKSIYTQPIPTEGYHVLGHSLISWLFIHPDTSAVATIRKSGEGLEIFSAYLRMQRNIPTIMPWWNDEVAVKPVDLLLSILASRGFELVLIPYEKDARMLMKWQVVRMKQFIQESDIPECWDVLDWIQQ